MSLLATSPVAPHGVSLAHRADPSPTWSNDHLVTQLANALEVAEPSLAGGNPVVLLGREWLEMGGVDATLLLADVVKVHPSGHGLPPRGVSDPVGVGGNSVPGFRPSSVPNFSVAVAQRAVPAPASTVFERDLLPESLWQSCVPELHEPSIYGEGMTPANWLGLKALGM